LSIEKPPPGMTSTVALKRTRNRLWGRFTQYSVAIDGERVGYIKNGHTLTFAVRPGSHTIRLSIYLQLFSNSETLEFTIGARETRRFVCKSYDPLALDNLLRIRLRPPRQIELFEDTGL
jgi:hypothetical protein